MKASELRNLNTDDLNQKLNALSQELLRLYYQKRVGSLDKPHLFRNVRREIAQVKTILKENSSAGKK